MEEGASGEVVETAENCPSRVKSKQTERGANWSVVCARVDRGAKKVPRPVPRNVETLRNSRTHRIDRWVFWAAWCEEGGVTGFSTTPNPISHILVK
jgi:hypothetical protein